MNAEQVVAAIAFALACVVPPALAWWWGRELLRHRQESLFAEQFWAYRRRLNLLVVTGGCLCGLTTALAGPRVAAGAVFVSMFVTLSVVHRVRCRALGETWRFGTYVTFRVRAVTALGGLWITIAATPALVHAAGSARWLVALLTMSLVFTWTYWYSAIATRIVGAEPLTSDAIVTAAQPVIAKTTARPPQLWRAGPAGGVNYNALALASLGGNRVLFFSTLLERLSPDEVVAILGHEIAHLEQFNPRVLRRQLLAILALTLCGSALVPWLLMRVESRGVVHLIWLAAVFITLAVLGRGSRARESDSDARALELTGDPDVLVSALISVHDAGLVPRRWDADFEARATHPTLARRIHAIYRLAGRTPERVARDTLVLPATEANAYLLVDHDRIRHLRNVSPGEDLAADALANRADHVDAYYFGRVSSVHLEPRGDQAVVAIRHADGKRTAVAVPAQYSGALQTRLDEVDDRFVARSPVTARWRLIRLATALVLVASILTLHAGAILVQTLLAMFVSSRTAAAAFAAAALTAGVLLLATPEPSAVAPLLSAILFAGSAIALVAVFKWPDSATASPARRTIIEATVLGVWTAVVIAFVWLTGSDLIRFSNAVAAIPAAIVAPVSIAAWCLARGRRPAVQLTALGFLLIAAMLAFAGTTWFIDRVSGDPLLTTRHDGESPAPFVRLTAMAIPLGAPRPVDGYGELRVSPQGQAAAVLEWCDESPHCDARPVTIVFDDQHRSLTALDLHFLDDERVLILEAHETGASVRVEHLNDALSDWQVALDGVSASRLDVDPSTGHWLVVGTRRGGTVRASGVAGDAHVNIREWQRPVGDEDVHAQWYTDEGRTPLGLSTDYSDFGDWWFDLRFLLMRSYEMLSVSGRATFHRWSDHTPQEMLRSTLPAHCTHAAAGVLGIICSAHDGSRTHLWRFFPDEGAPEPIGWIDGDLWLTSPPVEPLWLLSKACDWAIVDVAARRQLAISGIEDQCPTLALSGSTLAVLRISESATSEVQVYQLSVER